MIFKQFFIKIRSCVVGELLKDDSTCYKCPLNQYSIVDPNNKNNKN